MKGRSKTTYDARKDLDLRYVKNWGLNLDLKIFIKTIFILISPFNRGAY